MTDDTPPTKPGRWGRMAWLGVYALLCAADFVISTLKDFVEERIKGEAPDKDDDK
jgi:hypothetical protein